MYTEDTSDGPAIKCPGHPAETACEDYPNGACRRCNEVEDARLSRELANRKGRRG